VSDVRARFRSAFGAEPLVVRSPGRVNLIGEHTDYNEGFVLPATVDRAITLAVAPNGGRRYRLLAVDLAETHESEQAALVPSDRGWPNYLLGVVAQIRRDGPDVPGFDCAFGGDIPLGAGMSSSAAIAAGIAFALNEQFVLGLDRIALARIAQAAEHEFAGVRCGIMDQFVNLFGAAGHALKLDCRSLEYELVPFAFAELRIVLCDTGVKHALASSEYNLRRRQCEAGVRELRRSIPAIRSLRDVEPGLLEARRAEIEPVVYRRCRFVLEENARLLAGCADLARGDLVAFGGRMAGSHAGLRDDYEVSCPELDALVEIARPLPGVIGTRMMGGGFGGCTVNLVQAGAVESFAAAVQHDYRRRCGHETRVFVTRIAAGTAIVS
jgi:galactokinase